MAKLFKVVHTMATGAWTIPEVVSTPKCDAADVDAGQRAFNARIEVDKRNNPAATTLTYTWNGTAVALVAA